VVWIQNKVGPQGALRAAWGMVGVLAALCVVVALWIMEPPKKTGSSAKPSAGMELAESGVWQDRPARDKASKGGALQEDPEDLAGQERRIKNQVRRDALAHEMEKAMKEARLRLAGEAAMDAATEGLVSLDSVSEPESGRHLSVVTRRGPMGPQRCEIETVWVDKRAGLIAPSAPVVVSMRCAMPSAARGAGAQNQGEGLAPKTRKP
jgi:hypothetical protein